MAIQEITPECDTTLTNEQGQNLHRAWELNISDKTLVLERYGSICGWSEIKLKRNGKEMYRITKPWGGAERKEHFFGQSVRTYEGDQFSFVEYISQIAESERIPAAEELVQRGLDPNIERQYRSNLQRILDNKSAN